jgi:hypothetical protein
VGSRTDGGRALTEGQIYLWGLVNHLWFVAGTGGLPSLNNTFMQPFVNYLPGGGWTYAFNTETSYSWQASQWTAPVNVSAKKMFEVGEIPATVGSGCPVLH